MTMMADHGEAADGPDTQAVSSERDLIDLGPVEGFFDAIEDGNWAAGWARAIGDPRAVWLDAMIDDEPAIRFRADQLRADLMRADGSGGHCAFWFAIPEAYRDGAEHRIEIRVAHNGETLGGSPKLFTIVALGMSEARDPANVIPNADFLEWPSGLVMRPTERFDEPLTGWFFDFAPGTRPKVRLSADRPGDLALRPAEYAMRIVVEPGDDEALRLVVPLPVGAPEIARHRFSIGVRRPASATDEQLHVAEIAICTIDRVNLDRIATIRRNIRPRGTQRLLGLPAIASQAALTGIAPEQPIALVLELRGAGSLTLFSPALTPSAPARIFAADAMGDFEDENIRGQIDRLKLSPIWQPGRIAMPAPIATHAPAAAPDPLPARGLSAIPFIQIVVPVFNAATDVEELLRSIVRSTDSAFEILLLDDGSDAFAELRTGSWETLDPRIRYHRHRDNIGYTRNINIGLQSAVSEFVVLINSDTIVSPGWLRKLYQAVTVDDLTAAAGPLSNAASWQSVPRTKAANGDWIVNELPDGIAPARIDALIEAIYEGDYPEFPLLNGFCTIFRRAALDAIGYFDDELFPRGYGEENDLCLRLTHAGYTLRVATDTYVYHKKSRSFGNDQRKILSRESNLALRARHPSVSFAEIEEAMRGNPALNRIRHHLLASLGIEPVAPAA